jgi:hypothetical protein
MSRKACRQGTLEALAMRNEIPERINLFMQRYKLDLRGASLVFWSAEQTVRKWKLGSNTPPAVLGALLFVLERSEEARVLLGVGRFRNKNIGADKAPPRKKAVKPDAAAETQPAVIAVPEEPGAFVAEQPPSPSPELELNPVDIWCVTLPD